MNRTKLKSYLEVATNVAVLMASLVVLSVYGLSYLAGKPKTVLTVGLQKGQTVRALPQHDFGSSSQTLIIAMNTECHFCTESVPFYNQVIETQQALDKPTRVIAIFPNTEEEVKRYTHQQRLKADTISGVNLSALNLSATPTVILVDSGGRVLDFWIGKLAENAEQQIIKSLSSPKV